MPVLALPDLFGLLCYPSLGRFELGSLALLGSGGLVSPATIASRLMVFAIVADYANSGASMEQGKKLLFRNEFFHFCFGGG